MMLLVTFSIWFGPSRFSQCTDPPEKQVRVDVKSESYLTRYTLAETLRRVRDYEEAFNEKFRKGTAIEHTLLHVSKVEDLGDEEIDLSRCRMVEHLEEAIRELKAER